MRHLLVWAIWCLMRVLSPHCNLSLNGGTGSISHHHSDVGFLRVRGRLCLLSDWLMMSKRLQSCFGDRQTDCLSVSHTHVCMHTGHDHISFISLGNEAEEQAVLSSWRDAGKEVKCLPFRSLHTLSTVLKALWCLILLIFAVVSPNMLL